MIGDQHFLVVANYKSGGNYDQDSIVYLYDGTQSSNPFQLYQSIPTKGASDWEHFAIGDQHFLVVANYRSGTEKENYNLVFIALLAN